MEVPLLVWVGINGGLVIVASILTACFEVHTTIVDLLFCASTEFHISAIIR